MAPKPEPLPSFAWPGGYQILYLMADGDILCADCANENSVSPEHEDASWRLEGSFVHWEGPPMSCDHCNSELASEYGDPEEEN